MNRLLPYEIELKQVWNDLPLPDVNMAWEDMKRRLDKDDRRRFFPIWFTGCAGWGLLAILLVGLGWWTLRPEKWFVKEQESEQSVPATISNKDIARNDTLNYPGTINVSGKKIDSFIERTSKETIKLDPETSSIVKTYPEDHPIVTEGKGTIKPEEKLKIQNRKNQVLKSNPVNPNQRLIVKTNKIPAKPGEFKSDKGVDKPVIVENGKVSDSTRPDIRPNLHPIKSIDGNIVNTSADSIQKKDSIITPPKPDPAKIQPDNDSTKNRAFIISGGIGLHQQLPIAGQKWSPYSASGRKTSLADYIPSIYLRLKRAEKWFAQAEFRYGAPQNTKEFAFRQQIINDTGTNPRFRITNTSMLKKTFYHQLPLSFNYFILPNWSAGGGVQWNKFYAAITEKESIYRNNFTQQDSLLGKNIQKLDTDSATEFRKSYWQAMLQTQYKWEKLTIGARYNFGLQPYINFILPGGSPQQEKNSSFQLFLQLELFRTKNK